MKVLPMTTTLEIIVGIPMTSMKSQRRKILSAEINILTQV
jgi:hypothetical protein